MTQVISYEYDAIMGKYVSLEFGNFTNTLNNLMANISNSTQGAINTAMNSVNMSITSAINEAYNKVWASLQSSYCIFKGDSLMIVDALPSSEAVNVMKIDKDGISFSNSGINGSYNKAWAIEDILDFSKVTASNLTLNMIAGGILSISGTDAIEVYDANDLLIGKWDASGLVLDGMNVKTAINGKQDALTAGNGVDITSNVISVNNYTTIAKKVGTWIDGKDVYQITYELTATTAWDLRQVIATYPNDGQIIKANAVVDDSGTITMLPCTDFDLTFENGDIYINPQNSKSFASGSIMTLIIEYAK